MRVPNFTNELRFIGVLLVMALLIEVFGVDLYFAKQFYQLEGSQWILRDNFWTKSILHDTLKNILLSAYLLIIFWYFIQSCMNKKQNIFFKLAIFNVLLVVLAVSFLKQTTNVSCPWSLSMFGGDLEYHGTFKFFQTNQYLGQCFPGGHVSSVYSFLGFYFYAKLFAANKAKFLLSAILIAGLMLDISQQLRGAHFFSHNLWTLIIAWLSSLSLTMYATSKIANKT